jgi:hypothetical protein
MPSNVENSAVVLYIHIGQFLRVGELELNGRIIQKLHAFFVFFEGLVYEKLA